MGNTIFFFSLCQYVAHSENEISTKEHHFNFCVRNDHVKNRAYIKISQSKKLTIHNVYTVVQYKNLTPNTHPYTSL